MKNVTVMINDVAGGFVTLIKALIVAAIFANLLFTTGFNPVAHIVALVNTFMNGGLAGLLALMVFVSFANSK